MNAGKTWSVKLYASWANLLFFFHCCHLLSVTNVHVSQNLYLLGECNPEKRKCMAFFYRLNMYSNYRN